MKTVGVVVEYNPFHNGHAYHLAEAKRVSGADAVVAVMSGHWLQRGEPAVMNKWARAETALLAGVDLVLELPVAYSTQPAEWFAYGAISVLESTGVVDAVCFGSESGDAGPLIELASAVRDEPERFQAALQEELKRGLPYPAAYSAAAARYAPGPAARLIAEPNNSLGFHYILAMLRMNSRMQPLTIRRVKAGYNQTDVTDASIASATALRKLMLEDGGPYMPPTESLRSLAPYVPPTTLQVLLREWEAERAPLHWERYRAPLFHRLLLQSAQQLSAYREVTEGLEHRLKKALSSLGAGFSVERLLDQLKTKRYTRTKLQRMLTSIYLEHPKQTVNARMLRSGAPYLRVLGFSERGRRLLKRMKTAASVPVLTRAAERNPPPMLALDIAATAAYALGLPSAGGQDALADYYRSPFYIDGGVDGGGSSDK